jgi:hypothetical protein
MNKQNAKDYLPLVKALAEGKTIQLKIPCTEVWSNEENLEFSMPASCYRIKPESKLRPWKPEEVPVGALLRHKGYPSVVMIIGQSSGDIICWVHDEVGRMAAKECLDIEEHSLDGGKTWLPCGVMEDEE